MHVVGHKSKCTSFKVGAFGEVANAHANIYANQRNEKMEGWTDSYYP